MRLMHKDFGWKRSGLSFLGTRVWDSDGKMAASLWRGPAMHRLTRKAGRTIPLRR